MLNRRTMLALLGSTAIALMTPSANAAASVRVDVSRLVEQGWGANAALIKAGFEQALAGLGRADALLVVTVLRISMPSYSGSGGGVGHGGGTTDNIETEARLIGADGRVLASYPIVSSSPAASGGAWYDPDFDRRRLGNLIRNNAGWIRRYIGA